MGWAMWFVIPQHIPTMMACIGSFLLMADLHLLDMDRSMQFLGEVLASKGAIEGTTGDLIYGLVEYSQDRLAYSSRRMQWLWLHQLLYAFLQIFMSTAHVRVFLTNNNEMNTDNLLMLCTDLFHG